MNPHELREAYASVYKTNQTEEVTEVSEQGDSFDYLLDYLVSEGYADTNKSAIAIMANMGEQWKKSILEQILSLWEYFLPFTTNIDLY